jgi:hypothetical protein
MPPRRCLATAKSTGQQCKRVVNLRAPGPRCISHINEPNAHPITLPTTKNTIANNMDQAINISKRASGNGGRHIARVTPAREGDSNQHSSGVVASNSRRRTTMDGPPCRPSSTSAKKKSSDDGSLLDALRRLKVEERVTHNKELQKDAAIEPTCKVENRLRKHAKGPAPAAQTWKESDGVQFSSRTNGSGSTVLPFKSGTARRSTAAQN